MPYQVVGKTVQVEKSKDVWVDLKTHPSIRDAYKHLYALEKNVTEKEK